MDTFEILLGAIEAYSDANAEYKKAMEKVEYDRSYFCSREREALERTKKQLREALDEHVRRVVAMKEV